MSFCEISAVVVVVAAAAIVAVVVAVVAAAVDVGNCNGPQFESRQIILKILVSSFAFLSA